MKNMLIGGVVGLIFMAGGFWYGLRLKPLPTPISKEAAAAQALAAQPAPPPFSIDTLKKASESMMSLNEALKAREERVTAREQAVKVREDEIAAERSALDNSHEKFKALFEEFQQRLQLVEANQLDQLQKEAALFEGMSIDQAIDLIRVKDDAAITRLFSVMDTKPLGKLVAQWKTKYPEDGARLVALLDGIAQVMPKEKIALSDADASSAASAAASGTPAPDSTTAPAPDAATQPPASPDAGASPATTPAPAPTSDSSSAPSTDAAPPATTTAPAPLAPPPDSTQPAAAPTTTASN